MALAHVGRLAEALSAGSTAAALAPDSIVYAENVAYIRAMMGSRSEAEEFLRQLHERSETGAFRRSCRLIFCWHSAASTTRSSGSTRHFVCGRPRSSTCSWARIAARYEPIRASKASVNAWRFRSRPGAPLSTLAGLGNEPYRSDLVAYVGADSDGSRSTRRRGRLSARCADDVERFTARGQRI